MIHQLRHLCYCNRKYRSFASLAVANRCGTYYLSLLYRPSTLTQRLLITGTFRTTNIQAGEKEASLPQIALFFEHKLNIKTFTTRQQIPSQSTIRTPYWRSPLTPRASPTDGKIKEARISTRSGSLHGIKTRAMRQRESEASHPRTRQQGHRKRNEVTQHVVDNGQ